MAPDSGRDGAASHDPLTRQDVPILYSFRRCPYAMRARLAIVASRQRCVVREVVLRDKPPALLQASPKGTVPVLVLPEARGERIIDESLDIMRWALSCDDPHHWLHPERGDLRSMLALIAQCDGAFKRQLDRYKYPQRHAEFEDDEAASAFARDQREQAAEWLSALDAKLESGFLFGTRPALADMAILPFIRQYAHVDMAWFAAQPWPRLQEWLDAWKSSDLFAAVMPKFPQWREGDPPTFFPALD
ncbi:glutathione S-transferase [Allopusillimonas ginsengisoli]|uniref:glutathione S-transferase n=1 Tax=Allopusillimonas ginsengisoli TaxID=453575 RepID=UPI001021614B|nr:glutathione S-transferase [Allopusillimonas ginsengisoli]TEA79032.1 glutathione S-transferase [Allopusillimonas ginsengisoli]